MLRRLAAIFLLLAACSGHEDSVSALAKPPKPPVTCAPGYAPNPGGQCKPIPVPPPVSCPDGTNVPAGQTCPPVQCPDGSTVPNGQQCPVPPPIQCPDGSVVPAGGQCPVIPPPPVDCADGSQVPAGQTCPPVECPDGSVLPNGSTCPPPPPVTQTCPDGSIIPATDTCPALPPITSACKPLNMTGDDYLPSADMICTAVKTCHSYQFGTSAWQGGDPVVEAEKQYYVVRGSLWGIDDNHLVAWVPNAPGTPAYEIVGFPGWTLDGGAYFDRSCFDAVTPLSAGERG